MMKRRPGIQRHLKSGRVVPEADDVIELISSRCPPKWVAIDLEDGLVWGFFRDGRPRAAGLTELCECAELIRGQIRGINEELEPTSG